MVGSRAADVGGAALVGCGAADAIRPAVGGDAEGACGAADAVERPTSAGAVFGGCGAADAIGRPEVGGAALAGCGAADAIGRPRAGELTCADFVGASSLDLASVVFGLNPNAFRHVIPSTKYTPIAAPNATAKVSDTSHQGFQEEAGECMILGSSD